MLIRSSFGPAALARSFAKKMDAQVNKLADDGGEAVLNDNFQKHGARFGSSLPNKQSHFTARAFDCVTLATAETF